MESAGLVFFWSFARMEPDYHDIDVAIEPPDGKPPPLPCIPGNFCKARLTLLHQALSFGNEAPVCIARLIALFSKLSSVYCPFAFGFDFGLFITLQNTAFRLFSCG